MDNNYEDVMDAIPVCKKGCFHCNSTMVQRAWRMKKDMSSSNRKPWNRDHGHVVHGRRPVKLSVAISG